MGWQLAQVNVARLLAPLGNERLKDFVEALDPVNAAADVAPGFVWRLQTEDGNATAIRAFEWDAGDGVGVIVNLSVWTDLEHLAAYVFGEAHAAVLRRRREWFRQMTEAHVACWWIPAGERPTTDEAEDRVRYLRVHGPTPHAFTLRASYPAPGSAETGPNRGADDWLCPA
jgi:hypothetical protein